MSVLVQLRWESFCFPVCLFEPYCEDVYNTKKGKWNQAIGKAKFVGDENIAMLKVSFFGPFYSGYNVIAIDDAYKYVLIAGESLKYLWVLSRETTIPAEVKNKYLKIAEEVGYNTGNLIWVEHDKQK